MERFEEVRVFTAVVEAGSFVKAAEALRMSKAGVSRHVTELETRLGVRLMQRTTRRQSLTEEGQLFYERCKMLLAEVEDAETEVNSRSGEVGGFQGPAPQADAGHHPGRPRGRPGRRRLRRSCAHYASGRFHAG